MLFIEETIAHASDGIKKPSCPFQLFPEASYVGVNGSSIDEAIILPDILEQAFAGLYSSTSLSKHGQQFEFRGCQINLFGPNQNKV